MNFLKKMPSNKWIEIEFKCMQLKKNSQMKTKHGLDLKT